MKLFLSVVLVLLSFSSAFSAVPLSDNILFAFEKCKSLSVDLEKGQLKEAVTSSFDLHCLRIEDKPLELKCSYFDTGSNHKIKEEIFKGGSDLGVGELISENKKIRFLIGKNFSSYESGSEHKVCAGIFLFEKDALKRGK